MTHIDTTPEYDWFEPVFDDAKTIGAMMGITIRDIHFSGFWSQGDGACFTGNLAYKTGCAKAIKSYAPQDTELHNIALAWQNAHKATGYRITGTVKQSGHYCHEYCTEFTWPDTCGDCDALEETARDFMRWIYRALEREYEYQTAANAAIMWQEAKETMLEERATMRQLAQDMRTLRAAGISATLTVCTALRAQIRHHAQQWQEARNLRDALAEQFWYGNPRLTIAEFATTI